ncbi:hypothetical protein CF326_g2018 [Tilletia indica]|nr:hypothetical protein CF326_g2018 [Tilletia indica]
MVVRLRLARHGTRNNPFYHIVAIHNKKRRNALPIEKLGEYDPIPRWRPVPTPTSAAGPSSAVAARAERTPPSASSSSSSSTAAPAPTGSAAVANTPPPRSMAQVADVLVQERAQGSSSTSTKAQLAEQARPGYGLLMTSGLASELRLEKRIEWNEERIRYWIRVGAQPSKPVARLLDKAGLIPEGKWYKGMPPKPEDHKAPVPGKSTSTPTPISSPTATQTS